MKKTLSVLLAVLFFVSAFSAIGSAAEQPKAGDAQAGETFQFGWYPQKREDDPATIEALNAIGGSEAQLNGTTYRSLRLDEPSIPGKGSYFAEIYDYKTNETYWFACVPITWRVLENGENGVLLMADNVLDTYAFNKKVKSDNTWENSDVRAWLNSTFLDIAFSAKEQRFLLESYNTNEDNPVRGSYNGVPSAYKGDFSGGYPYQGTESGNDTVDRVFLPSFKEITTEAYGFNVGYHWIGDFGQDVNYYVSDAGSGRQAIATEYAQGRGVWTNTTDDNSAPANEFCRYWLRTAGYANNFAAGVLEDGRVSTGWYVNYNILGIRPMIRVSKDAVADKRIQIIVNFPEGDLRYRNPNVQLTANEDVIWSTSDPSIATIDENGLLTVHDVGVVTITATLVDDPDTFVSGTVTVRYVWWQWIIRIVLLGWIWY